MLRCLLRSDSGSPPSTSTSEYPVVSARFLADNLGVSTVSGQKLVKQLDSVGIVRTATGKYWRSALCQADDILELLEHGADVTR